MTDEKPRPKAFRPDLHSYEGVTPQSLVDDEPVRQHITDGGACWCGPTIAHVAAGEPAERDMLITDITSYSEDTMFKVQAAITSLGYSGQPVLDLIGAMQNAGILFREHGPEYTTNDKWVGLKNTEYHVNVNGGEATILPDDEQGFEDDGLESYKWAGDPHHGHEYDHYSERSRTICAGGDHDAAVMWDRDLARVKVRENEEASDTIKSENVEATMAEEPIQDRLRRAWINGFRDGVERAAYAQVESTGRWDY
jgi:hypothetical protein